MAAHMKDVRCLGNVKGNFNRKDSNCSFYGIFYGQSHNIGITVSYLLFHSSHNQFTHIFHISLPGYFAFAVYRLLCPVALRGTVS